MVTPGTSLFSIYTFAPGLKFEPLTTTFSPPSMETRLGVTLSITGKLFLSMSSNLTLSSNIQSVTPCWLLCLMGFLIFTFLLSLFSTLKPSDPALSSISILFPISFPNVPSTNFPLFSTSNLYGLYSLANLLSLGFMITPPIVTLG